MFLSSRESNNSALRALWPVFCRKLLPASSGDRADINSISTIAYNRIRMRTAHMRAALASTPEMASTVSQVTIAAPVYIEEVESARGRFQARVYIESTSTWHNLFLRLYRMHELRLVAIPFRKTRKRSGAAQQALLSSIPMPSSVKRLYVEDIMLCSCGDEDEHDLHNCCEISNVASLFGQCQDVELLHVKTPVLTREQAERVQRFDSLTEFRADVSNIFESVENEDFMELLEDLGSLPQLTTVDLRYTWLKYSAGQSPFPDDWTVYLPNIHTLRMPLVVFFPAFATEFQSVRPTPLNIELLFDNEGAIRGACEEATEVQRSLADKVHHHYTRNQPALQIPGIKQRFDAIASAMALVERAENLLQLRQVMGELEMRTLKVVQCDWAEDGVGPAWFSYKYEEKDSKRALNLLIWNEEGAREGLARYDFGTDSEDESGDDINDSYEQDSEDEESEEDEEEGESESGDHEDDNEVSDEWSDREDDEETDEEADEDSSGEDDEGSDEEDGEDGDE